MIRSVTVTNYLGDLTDNLAKKTNENTIHIDLRDGEPSHGMTIESITGLGPAKATLNRTELATTDGSLFNSSKLEERNIVMSIIFREAPTIEDARVLTYKYFPIKQKLIFSVLTDNRDARVVGYVESNEPDIFQPLEKAQISILCPDPYFYSNRPYENPNTISFSGLESEFEWPMENNSLTQNLVEFGNITRIVEKYFVYNGDQEIGVSMRINYTDTVNTDFDIYHFKSSLRPNEPERMSTFKISIEKLQALMGTSFVSGDSVIINTVRGQEKITLLRGGIEYNILNAVTRDSDWFQVAKGLNRFTIDAFGSESKLLFEVKNYVIYEGV